jgi:hypothetical protein
MAACVVSGLFCGLILAVPTSIIFTAIIMSTPKPVSSRRTYEYEYDDDQDWRPWYPEQSTTQASGAGGQASAQAIRTAPSGGSRPRPQTRERADLFGCPSCGWRIPLDDNRLPPWCPRCGNDLKISPKPPVPAPAEADIPAVLPAKAPPASAAPSTAVTSNEPNLFSDT